MLTITGLYAALLFVLLLILSYRVTMLRREERVGIGIGSKKMHRAIRAHANFVENVPFALILLAALEMDGSSNMLLHVCGTTLLGARILHGYGLSMNSGVSLGRFLGTMLTWLSMLIMSCWLLAHFFGIRAL